MKMINLKKIKIKYKKQLGDIQQRLKIGVKDVIFIIKKVKYSYTFNFLIKLKKYKKSIILINKIKNFIKIDLKKQIRYGKLAYLLISLICFGVVPSISHCSSDEVLSSLNSTHSSRYNSEFSIGTQSKESLETLKKGISGESWAKSYEEEFKMSPMFESYKESLDILFIKGI
jgi:hypothetical protein